MLDDRPSHTKATNINFGIVLCCACLLCVHINKFFLCVYACRSIETRPNPTRRDEDFVRSAVALATPAQPFAGHKGPPLLCRWPGYAWYRMNLPDLMHGMIILHFMDFMHDMVNSLNFHTFTRRLQGSMRKHHVPFAWSPPDVLGDKGQHPPKASTQTWYLP